MPTATLESKAEQAALKAAEAADKAAELNAQVEDRRRRLASAEAELGSAKWALSQLRSLRESIEPEPGYQVTKTVNLAASYPSNVFLEFVKNVVAVRVGLELIDQAIPHQERVIADLEDKVAAAKRDL